MVLVVAGQWNRAAWLFQPTALSHTPSHIVKAFESFLTQSGWERSSWSGSLDDRYYLRTDRRSLNFTNDGTGTGGNVLITKTGANLTVAGLSGGTGAVKATGYLTLSAQPADGDTITISDGVTPVTFEFDSNAAVSGGNILVTIGTKVINTLDNLLTVVNANAIQVTASLVSDVWRYNGDALEQNCGLHVKYDSANSRIEVSSFLENVAGTTSQIETPASGYSGQNQKILVSYNLTLSNDWVLYGGEDGLYFETGVNGISQNIGHGMIMTFTHIPEFAGTKDAKRKWTAQGLCCNLFGALVWSEDRNCRFVDNNGASRNYTGRLRPYAARGSYTMLASTPSDNPAYPIAPRDNFIGIVGGNAGNSDTTGQIGSSNYFWCSFGLANTPIDDRYKISPLWMLQHCVTISVRISSNPSASNNIGVDGAAGAYIEPRWLRKIPRFAACDQTLIPFSANVTDQITGTIYRVAKIQDNGRVTNMAVEYPSTIVTIPTTPTV